MCRSRKLASLELTGVVVDRFGLGHETSPGIKAAFSICEGGFTAGFYFDSLLTSTSLDELVEG